MSLFPAYSNEVIKHSTELKDSNEDLRWLKNSSYQTISSYLNSSLKNENWEDSSDEEYTNFSLKKNKHESICENKKICKEKISKSQLCTIDCQETKQNNKDAKKNFGLVRSETHLKNKYFEDKDRNKRFLNLETLEFTMRPIYNLWNNKLNIKKRNKQKHFKRYHAINLDAPKKLKNKKSKIIHDYATERITEINDEIKISNLEDTQKVKIKEFNEKLTECPKDIHTWLEYVHFQDHIQLSTFFIIPENIKQVINQRKLSIIEKGLAMNSNSIELLEMKLQLMSKLLPADQFSNEIEAMIKQDLNNIILWQTLMTLIRTSCVFCKVSKVLNLYVKYSSVLKKKSKTDSKFYDKQILESLYQCLTFLRHAGLWEQMWEIIKINLCLNLDLDYDTFKNINTIDEKILMNMEELILTSKLPLNQLWLRIESLRERCHWTSVNIEQVDINLIGDEKRLVSIEETNDFIYPTISMESNFRLVILSLLCLKIPFLPSRHWTLKNFLGEKDFWTIDSLEIILPLIYSTISIGPVDKYIGHKTMITSLLEGELTSGPQLLKFHPAQESYLDFIRLVFCTIAQKLPTTQRTSIYIWWLKFERLLVFVDKHDSLSKPNRNKKIKSIIKNFLKKPENRNNLYFYKEFALLVYEIDGFDSCIQMLKRIIQSQDIKILEVEDKTALFSLYRTIFEILLDSNTYKNSNLEIFNEIVETLQNHTCVCFNYNKDIALEKMLYEEIIKFLTNSVVDEPEDAFILPNIHCDILMCYVYLLYNKNNETHIIHDILNLFDRCIIHCNNCFRLQERFYEVKVAFLQFYQDKIKEYERILIQVTSEAIHKFANNLFILSVNALNEIKLPCWKLKTSNKRYNIWSILANCLAGRARIIYLKSIKFEEAYNAIINKMLSFHKTISKTEEVQNCPLVWRFYMLLLREHDLCKKKGEEIYYQAVAQCPWARSVYISAAEIAPQILPQIQDLIKEKELRMHVTPDELDILRG